MGTSRCRISRDVLGLKVGRCARFAKAGSEIPIWSDLVLGCFASLSLTHWCLPSFGCRHRGTSPRDGCLCRANRNSNLLRHCFLHDGPIAGGVRLARLRPGSPSGPVERPDCQHRCRCNVGRWHLPLFFVPEMGFYYQRPIWGLVLSTILISIPIAWVYNNTGRSILAAMLMHASFNWAHFLFPTLDSDRAGLILFVVQAAVAVIVVLVWGPSTLTRKSHASDKRPSEGFA